MTSSKPKTFVIIGLGLMGGSLAAALKRRFPKSRVMGVSRRLKTLRLAKQKKLIHEGSLKLDRVVGEADFVFICTPVDTIPRFIALIDCFAKPGTIVTDVGSTKRSIVRWADRMGLKHIRFIGSHPLAGSHETGLKYAQADLYREALVFLTPTTKSNRSALAELVRIWRTVGAKTMILSPERHDQIVSETSHMPHAVASVLVHSVLPKFIRYGASGFLDTTRIAQGDPLLWTPIFMSNRTHLVQSLKRFQTALMRLIRLIEAGSGKQIFKFLNVASNRRRNTPKI